MLLEIHYFKTTVSCVYIASRNALGKKYIYKNYSVISLLYISHVVLSVHWINVLTADGREFAMSIHWSNITVH